MAGLGDQESDGGQRLEKKTTASEQAAVSRPRRQLTGPELEARFTDWRARRREGPATRTPESDGRALRRAGIGLLTVAILGLVIAAGVSGERFEAARAVNDSRIADLDARLAEAEAAPVDPDTATKLSRLAEAVATDATRVASAQQDFAGLYHQASTQPDPGNGVPNQAVLDIAEHRRVLAGLFDPASYLVHGEQAYQWSTLALYDETVGIDPRYAWYIRYDGLVASEPGAYTWTVQSAMPDLGSQKNRVTTDRAQAVWVCRDAATDEVLAWASGSYTYDGTAGVFDALEVIVTPAGARHRHQYQQDANRGGNR